MQTVSNTVVTLVLVMVLSAACAMRQKRVEKELAHPHDVNCATADGDLRMLQHEKAHVADRIAEGVMAIYPAGLVIGILTGTERTKLKVSTGDYNEAIDKRIAQIKRECGVQ